MTRHPPLILLGHAMRALGAGIAGLAGLAAVGALVGLACILVLVACGGPRPSDTRSPAASGSGVQAGGISGLLIGDRDGLFLGASDGTTVALDWVRGPVAGVTSAGGVVVVQMVAGEVLRGHVTPHAAWEPLLVSAAGAIGPFSGLALSPDGKRLAVLSGMPGSGQPSAVVVADAATGNGRSIPFRGESNGPPQWLDDTSLLLEMTTDGGGPAFLRLDLTGGQTDSLAASGRGPALSADRSFVAVAADELLVLPTRAWLVGATGTAEVISSLGGGVIDLALDADGGRLAVAREDSTGAGATISVYDGSGDGWVVVSTLRLSSDGPVALAWLDQ